MHNSHKIHTNHQHANILALHFFLINSPAVCIIKYICCILHIATRRLHASWPAPTAASTPTVIRKAYLFQNGIFYLVGLYYKQWRSTQEWLIMPNKQALLKQVLAS